MSIYSLQKVNYTASRLKMAVDLQGFLAQGKERVPLGAPRTSAAFNGLSSIDAALRQKDRKGSAFFRRQPPKTSFFAWNAGMMPAFFKKMRASRPRSQGFSEVALGIAGR